MQERLLLAQAGKQLWLAGSSSGRLCLVERENVGICPLSMSDQPILAAVWLASTRLLSSSGVPQQAPELPHGPSRWDGLLGESTSKACPLAFFLIAFHLTLLQLGAKHMLASCKLTCACSWSFCKALYTTCRASVRRGGKPSTIRTMQLPTSSTMTAKPHLTQTLTRCPS